MPPQRWHRSRSDGAADRTSALAHLRGRGWHEPTLQSGTRDPYVTLRWLIEPSSTGTLGTSGWLSASALISVPEIGHTSRPGKRALPVCIRPITKYRLANSCRYRGARADAPNNPDFSAGGHFILDDPQSHLANQKANYVWFQTVILVRANARAHDSRVSKPAVPACGTGTRVPEFRAFPKIFTGCHDKLWNNIT